MMMITPEQARPQSGVPERSIFNLWMSAKNSSSFHRSQAGKRPGGMSFNPQLLKFSQRNAPAGSFSR